MLEHGKSNAWNLLGQTTPRGWYFAEPVGWDPDSKEKCDHYNGSGGNFSVPYRVTRGREKAFLKAIDLNSAMAQGDKLKRMNNMLQSHLFEESLLKKCESANIDRVVHALESGVIECGAAFDDLVPFIVFELAEGDVRRSIQKQSGLLRLSWWLKAMHHTAVGLQQLHGHGISHQDLKPSNILCFTGTEFKIADLGRSLADGLIAPHDPNGDKAFTGDLNYVPPEIAYGYIENDVHKLRRSCDMYMLGSMIFFYLLGIGMTHLLFRNLQFDQRPKTWHGSFDGGYLNILDQLQLEHEEAVQKLGLGLHDIEFGNEIVAAARSLTNPDPKERGKMTGFRSTDQFSFERFISLFDRLSKLAALKARQEVNNVQL